MSGRSTVIKLYSPRAVDNRGPLDDAPVLQEIEVSGVTPKSWRALKPLLQSSGVPAKHRSDRHHVSLIAFVISVAPNSKHHVVLRQRVVIHPDGSLVDGYATPY